MRRNIRLALSLESSFFQSACQASSYSAAAGAPAPKATNALQSPCCSAHCNSPPLSIIGCMASSTPTPALVVISGGRASAAPVLDTKCQDALLRSLPAAQRVLEIDGGGPALGDAYCRLHAGSHWQRSSSGELAQLIERFDLIVIGTLAPTLHTEALLQSLHRLANDETALWLVAANAARFALLRQWVEADLSGVDGDDETQPRGHLSASSLFKRLMDAGWMPNLAATTAATGLPAAAQAAALALAETLGVPSATAQRNLSSEQLIVGARRSFIDAPPASGPTEFAVVVPTTRESQLRLNVERSPGLQEVGARIVSYRGARSPADAFEQSIAHVDADWVLLCHQDVYFPRSFGHRLNALLASIPASERPRTLIGFIGKGADRATGSYVDAGFVIDRTHRAEHSASDAAVSIDELAIVLSRDSIHRIDPALGWHLWATDLCLAAICKHRVFPRIVRLPLFHNSTNDYQLPQAFAASAATLVAKYPDHGPIPTLCGTIDEHFIQSFAKATA